MKVSVKQNLEVKSVTDVKNEEKNEPWQKF